MKIYEVWEADGHGYTEVHQKAWMADYRAYILMRECWIDFHAAPTYEAYDGIGWVESKYPDDPEVWVRKVEVPL